MTYKSLLFISTFLFVNILFIKAQSSINFPTQDATWQEGYYIAANQIIPERRVLCGDTTINNKTYARIYSIIFNNQGTESGRYYEGAVRGEIDQVFWIPKNATMESILYDWSLESTQTITLQTITGSENTLTAKSNQYITTSDGIFRRVIVFKSQAGAEEEVWIEGIGSSSGIIARGVNPNESPDYVPFLNCYRYETEIVYTHPNPPLACNYIFNENCLSTSIEGNGNFDEIKFTVYPNPFLDKFDLEMDGFEMLKNPILKIFDLQGQLVITTHLQKNREVVFFEQKINAGIYILEVWDDLNEVVFREKMIKVD